MHIVHLTPYYAPAYPFGGVARACEGMCRALAGRGHRVTVLTTDALSQSERYDGPATESRDGVQVLRARNASVWLRGNANLSTPMNLHALAAEALSDADILHCHEFRTTENLMVTPIAARQNVPIVLSPHGTLTHGTGRSTLKQMWDALLSPGMGRRFNVVLGLTDDERDEAKALWETLGARATFDVVPNGVNLSDFDNLPDPSAFRQKWGVTQARVVLYMGRLHPRKGADKLARAFIAANPPDTHLLIVGPDEGLRATIEQLTEGHANITLTGYLGGSERLGALAAASVFALPAVGEGLPMTALEAMACGVPVLLSPECHLPGVEPAGAGRIVSPDVPALTQALRDTLSADLHQMGAAAQAFVQQQYTWSAVAAQLEHIYEANRR